MIYTEIDTFTQHMGVDSEQHAVNIHSKVIFPIELERRISLDAHPRKGRKHAGVLWTFGPTHF